MSAPGACFSTSISSFDSSFSLTISNALITAKSSLMSIPLVSVPSRNFSIVPSIAKELSFSPSKRLLFSLIVSFKLTRSSLLTLTLLSLYKNSLFTFEVFTFSPSAIFFKRITFPFPEILVIIKVFS